MEAQTRRRTVRANPDLVLATLVAVTREEVNRLQQKQQLQVACEHCALPPGLADDERRWVAQALRDLTKLALGARRQVLDRILRNLTDGGLTQVADTGADGNWLPE